MDLLSASSLLGLKEASLKLWKIYVYRKRYALSTRPTVLHNGILAHINLSALIMKRFCIALLI